MERQTKHGLSKVVSFKQSYIVLMLNVTKH